MHSSIQVNICLIFHDGANQRAPNKSASLCSGKSTGSAYSWGTWGWLSPSPLWGRCLSGSLLPPPCCNPPPSLGHFGPFLLRSRWHIFICLALSTNVLSLLGVLQIFSLWFSKTQCWKFRSMILTADLLSLLEAMVSFEDGLLFLSASTPLTSCGFQLHGVQLSWLFLGYLRSKRKQRPYFLITLLCLAVVQRGGGHLLDILCCQPLAKEGTGAAGGSSRASYVTSSLVPKRNNWVYAGRGVSS